MEPDHGILDDDERGQTTVLALRAVLQQCSRQFAIIFIAVSPCLLLVVGTECAWPEEFSFLDDFEDGNLRDGNPVRWGQGTVDNGSQRLSATGITTSSALVDQHLGWSMQTEASIEPNGFWVGVGIIFDQGNVWLGFSPSGALALGIPGRSVEQALTDLDPSSVMLRLDAFDDTLHAWAWQPGEWQPEEPMVTIETPLSPGRPGVWMESGDPPVTAEFEFFEASTSPLPINPLEGYLAGDADMDWDFDQLDLVRVQVAGKYLTGQHATWGEGDWDGAPGTDDNGPPPGDSLFDQRDIIVALASGLYLTGPYASVREDASLAPTTDSSMPGANATFVRALPSTELLLDVDSGVETVQGSPINDTHHVAPTERVAVPEPSAFLTLLLGFACAYWAWPRRR